MPEDYFDSDTCEIFEGDYCGHLWDLWQDALWSGNGEEADRLVGEMLANLGGPDDDEPSK